MARGINRRRDNTFTGMNTEDEVRENIRVLIDRVGTSNIDLDALVDAVIEELLNRGVDFGDGGDETTITEGSSTPFSFRRVDDLPSISADTPEIVIWNSPNGDDDFWVSKPGTAYWAPLAHFSNLDGTP